MAEDDFGASADYTRENDDEAAAIAERKRWDEKNAALQTAQVFRGCAWGDVVHTAVLPRVRSPPASRSSCCAPQLSLAEPTGCCVARCRVAPRCRQAARPGPLVAVHQPGPPGSRTGRLAPQQVGLGDMASFSTALRCLNCTVCRR